MGTNILTEIFPPVAPGSMFLGNVDACLLNAWHYNPGGHNVITCQSEKLKSEIILWLYFINPFIAKLCQKYQGCMRINVAA
jgi:hypothetical protein